MKPPLVYSISDFRWRGADYARIAFRPYALAIGQSTLAWNDLHERLSEIFNDILFALGLNTPDNTYALAIWNSSTSDRAKRKMLDALSNSLYEGCFVRKRLLYFPKGRVEQLQTAIKYILKEANSLEDARNNAIHAPLHSTEGIDDEPGQVIVEPMDYLGNQRAQRMVGKNLLAEYKYLRDSARVLANYSDAVMEAFLQSRDTPVAWPSTPKMPNREQNRRHQGRRRHHPPR
jgi:hypothetical protein